MGATGQAADGGLMEPGADREPAQLHVRNAACRRGGRLLFTALNLSLTAGQSALVSGPNGIGKSSLLRMICGLLPTYAGSINVRGQMALADERLAFDMDQPLGQALRFWAGIDEHVSRIAPALSAMALTPLSDVPVRMLSTGQRKRAVLARVIASGAPIWLLDEPANGLDIASLALLDRAIQQHLQQGGIIVAASHQPLPLVGATSLTLARPQEASEEFPEEKDAS